MLTQYLRNTKECSRDSEGYGGKADRGILSNTNDYLRENCQVLDPKRIQREYWERDTDVVRDSGGY